MIRLLNGLVFVVCLIVALPISLVYWAVHMFRDIFKKKDVSAEELDALYHAEEENPEFSEDGILIRSLDQYQADLCYDSQGNVFDGAEFIRGHFNKKEYCSYHPEVELTDACDGDTPTPCIECWDDYRYPEEEF